MAAESDFTVHRNSILKLGGSWSHVTIKRNGDIWCREIPKVALSEGKVFAKKDFENYLKNNPGYHLYAPDDLEGFGIQKSDLAVKFPSALAGVVDRLEEGDRVSKIPITTLRTFYQWLRDMPTRIDMSLYEVQAGIMDTYLTTPSTLAKLFLSSRERFESYENIGETFIGDGDRLIPPDSERSGTNEFVKQLLDQNQGHGTFRERDDLGFEAIAREVSFIRSSRASGRRWVREDGGSSADTGSGGIDLLLRNKDDGVPIVAEVKIANDTTPFFALIQALTYAAELCTQNQLKRLSASFPDSRFNTTHGVVDIYIITKNPPVRATLLDEKLRTIIQGMFEQNKDIGTFLRRIVFVEAVGGKE